MTDLDTRIRDAIDNRERGMAYEDDRSVEEYRERYPEHLVAVDALRSILDLEPPTDDRLDTDTLSLLTDGWNTCHHAVMLAVADALGLKR